MKIAVIDERGEKSSTMELSGVANDSITITIGKDGSISVRGNTNPVIDWTKGWQLPYYGANPNTMIQPCNGVMYI